MAEPIKAIDLPARTKTIYPPPYAAALEGRAKRAMKVSMCLRLACVWGSRPECPTATSW